MAQYSEDYDEILTPRVNGAGIPFEDLLAPYIKSTGVYMCPSNPRSQDMACPQCNPIIPGYTSVQHVSYAADSGQKGGMSDQNGRPLGFIQAPAQVICLVESTAGYTDFDVDNPTTTWRQQQQNGSGNNNGNLFSGHTGTSNYLFLDYHVKALKPMATLDKADGG